MPKFLPSKWWGNFFWDSIPLPHGLAQDMTITPLELVMSLWFPWTTQGHHDVSFVWPIQSIVRLSAFPAMPNPCTYTLTDSSSRAGLLVSMGKRHYINKLQVLLCSVKISSLQTNWDNFWGSHAPYPMAWLMTSQGTYKMINDIFLFLCRCHRTYLEIVRMIVFTSFLYQFRLWNLAFSKWESFFNVLSWASYLLQIFFFCSALSTTCMVVIVETYRNKKLYLYCIW